MRSFIATPVGLGAVVSWEPSSGTMEITMEKPPRSAFWWAKSLWAWVELNYRPHAYQACALTT